jgi:hypothetical protein
MGRILQSFQLRSSVDVSVDVYPEAISLTLLMLTLVGIIENNFVFVPICPIADLADASEVFPAQPAS